MKRAMRTRGVDFVPLYLAASLFFAAPVKAQQTTAPVTEDGELEVIVVTGSRIPQGEFSSPSPIQVFEVDQARQIGISSIAEMLRQATVTNGTQIDSSLNNIVAPDRTTEEPPPGGVGSSNISLRGLEPERTLILMNGRRLGSAGVRGAPSQPDMSLIPFALVDRVEVLTEGVSAVYGADAVAGVVNVILRDDIDGFEIIASSEVPSDAGGEINQISLLAGSLTDRSSFQFAAEYMDRERVTTGSRDWAHCRRDIEQIEDGRIESVCRSGFFDNVAVDSFINFYFFTEGQTDIGVPDWSSANALPPPSHPLVADPANTVGRFTFIDLYNDQDERRAADLVGELERFSFVSTGSLRMDWWANEEIYFEGLYLNSRVFSKASHEQFFPVLLGQIPQEDANGNIIVDANGVPILVDNPLNPFPGDFEPFITLDSVPQHRDVEREQSRLVLGMRGDIGETSWAWDSFISYDRGIGFQSQAVFFEPHLQLSINNLRIDANGDVICDIGGIDFGLGFFSAEECVPLDFANPNLYVGGPTGEGTLTEAEARYLVGNRTNRTVVEQTILSAYATGDWFDLGDDRTVQVAVGAEYRVDEIDSQNDIVGVLGLNAVLDPLQEGESIGDRDIFEVFAETRLPLLDELNLDAAVRYTDEENFGSEVTWRARLAWRPVDYVTLSGSAGTSFRAPNLREQFLADIRGVIGGAADPCAAVRIQQEVLFAGSDSEPVTVNLTNNCALAGVEMADTDGNGFLDTSLLTTIARIAVVSGGSQSLEAERSETITATLSFTQPWTDRFDFDFVVSYWDIVIENTVGELQAFQTLNSCYRDIDFPNLGSPLCSRHSRPVRPDGFSDLIDVVDVSFFNIGEHTAKGLDFNTRFQYSFVDTGIDLSWLMAATLQLEQERQFLSVDDRDDNLGEIGFPEWRLTSTLSLTRGDWELLMQNRYIGSGEQDEIQEFEPRRFSPLLSRGVAWVDSVWYTDLSITYGKDSFSVSGGVKNLFDEPPPLISSFSGPNRNNAVTSSGYDLFGRSFFVTARIGF